LKDAQYLHFKDELAFSQTNVEEVEARLKNLNGEYSKVVDQVQQILYMKS
jgi:hypothetical protein